jgi:hypothetical protein
MGEEVKPEHVLALLALLFLARKPEEKVEVRVPEVEIPEVEVQPVPSVEPVPRVEIAVPQPVPILPPVELIEERVIQPAEQPIVYEKVETMPEPVVLTAVIELWFTRDAQYPRTIRVYNLDATRSIYVYAYFSTETEKCINVNGYRLCGEGKYLYGAVMREPKRLVIPASNIITINLEDELTGLERIDVELHIPTLRTPRIDCKGYACGIAEEIDVL